jgi:hypothetical protein
MLLIQDIDARLTLLVDIDVTHRGEKPNFWRAMRIVGRDKDLNSENSSFVETPRRTLVRKKRIQF